METRILLVEDDATLRETLMYHLQHQGYTVAGVGDGLSALARVHEFQPDLILLDVMLPGLDGFEVCRRLREAPETMKIPIIMLTARSSASDKVMGLEWGADDYVTKPFDLRELQARIKAHLRREERLREEATEEESLAGTRPLVFADLTIDLVRHEVTRRGVKLDLKPREFDLLLFLVRHRGMVLSRELILERVWGWDFAGNTRTVDVHIRWLREKIEEDPAHPQRIVTVRGIGYRFEG